MNLLVIPSGLTYTVWLEEWINPEQPVNNNNKVKNTAATARFILLLHIKINDNI
jgi:hypothetical protein